jgi:hypothetical protein
MLTTRGVMLRLRYLFAVRAAPKHIPNDSALEFIAPSSTPSSSTRYTADGRACAQFNTASR